MDEKKKKFKMFVSPTCGACVRIKSDLEASHLDSLVEFVDISTAEGLAEAAWRDALSTPLFFMGEFSLNFKEWRDELEKSKLRGES